MPERSFQKFTQRLGAIGLREQIEKRCRALHVSLRDLYEGPDRAQSIAVARRAVYGWLMKTKGKGINEIARLFDRAPNGVWKLTREKISQ